MELLRSLIFVPGNRANMLEKARDFPADVIVADLEDSVPPGEKVAARDMVQQVGPGLSAHGQKLMVRLNSLDTGLTKDELDAVIGPHLYGVSLGKVESTFDIREMERIAGALEASHGLERGRLRLIPWLESARGVHFAYEIATASPRIVGVAFGGEDYTQDMGVRRTESGEEVYHARAQVAVAARAARVVALDGVYVRFRDQEGLEADVGRAVSLGYKGKFAIHPSQIDTFNRMFSPWPEDVEYARRVVEAWEEAEAEGRGSVALDGNMVDVPVVKRARDLLALAQAIEAASSPK